VQTFGTGSQDDLAITRRVAQHFDLRLGAIVRDFRLTGLDPRRYAGRRPARIRRQAISFC
jgi:S-adenosylmethionine synthetase